MNVTTDPATILADIPGWQGASYRELPGGLTNRTLLVEKAGRRAVLKIDPAPRMPPYNPRREEALIQDRAAALGRANGVLYVHETVLLAEWSEGEVWTRAHFDEDDNLRHREKLRPEGGRPPVCRATGRGYPGCGGITPCPHRFDARTDESLLLPQRPRRRKHHFHAASPIP
jgi:hypothetical protein